ncbi:porin family protein [uncultured Sphingomonas sp.]|uniref:outer membrane protein n=1 Tax=uncultured Sphingomonas sp. TaxID=158754 RepID=UPI0025E4CD6C|nr:porin family protein [uncultured Sphingomonas sp.]
MRSFIAPVIALMASATPAFAQDSTFQGPRVEALAGWDNVKGNGTSLSGFTYGGAAGYDLQLEKTVLGIEGEVTGSTAKKTFDDFSSSTGRDLYVGGRIGYIVAPATLLYGKVGYDNSRVVERSEEGRLAKNLDGLRLGAGVEHSFGKYYGKLEYRYTNLTQNLVRHQVLAGLGVRF